MLEPDAAIKVTMDIRPKGNVLIIEDDDQTREMLLLTLVQQGYGVRATSNRGDAALLLSKNLYEVVLLDFYMPGMSAQEFVSDTRRISPRTSIILVTAANEVSDCAAKLGLSFFLGKPFTREQLLNKMQAASL
jgi:DNA-binding response OmpR family regulator